MPHSEIETSPTYSQTGHSPAKVSDADSDLSRLGGYFSLPSILFVGLCVAGLAMGLAYTFGVPIMGQRLLEGQYYWIFIGLFTAMAFIALPAMRGQKRIPVFDMIAAAMALAISLWFSAHAWDMVQAGWTNLPMGVAI